MKIFYLTHFIVNIKRTSLIFIIGLTLFSCKSNYISDYKHNYTPITKASTKPYKSVQKRANQNEQLALGVAVSGGGSRAQYFATGALIGLDDIKNSQNSESTFLKEVDYFSTVSGGGFGVGYYMAVKDIGVFEHYDNYNSYWNSNDRKLSFQSFVYKRANIWSTLFGHWTYEKGWSNYTQNVNQKLLQKDKIDIYKTKLNQQRTYVKELNLGDFFIDRNSSQSVIHPMFVTNGTIYNNAERLPFMPHIIKDLKISGDYFGEDFKKVDGFSMPLTYAVTGSASFPGALPMLKFRIKDSEQVLRVLDGGVVDNLGYRTLFELLDDDNVPNPNKRALLISCSGTGAITQLQSKKTVSLGSLITKSLLFTVDSKDLAVKQEIDYQAKSLDIDTSNVHYIGMSNIRKHLINLLENENDITIILPNVESKKSWEWEYVKLTDSLTKSNGVDYSSKAARKYKYNNLSDLPTSEFEQLSIEGIAQIYSLASSIITKVKIYPWEKEILVLAGRYLVYLERDNIEKLLH